MSDPVKNSEVEDFLSSIRRLVSDEHRMSQGNATRMNPSYAPSSGAAVDRLVLTPALRVADDTAGSARDAGDADAGAAPVHGTPLQDEGSDMQDKASGTPAALADDYSTDPYNFRDALDADGDRPFMLDEEQLISDVSTDPAFEVQAEEILDPISAALLRARTGPKSDASRTPAKPDPEPTAPNDQASAAFGSKIAALETAIGEIPDIWEPDHAGESDYAGTEAQEMTWEDDEPEQKPAYRPILPPVSLKSDASDGPEATTEDTVEDVPAAGAFTSSRARPAQPAAQGRVTADDAPVRQEDAPELDDNAADASFDEAYDGDTYDGDTYDGDTYDGDIHDDDDLDEDEVAVTTEEHFIDEEILREMVSDIVRAELQGALGERITRNVRKLVRREINRALAAQELE